MPPFTTVNGQTGYYYGGTFVPATQQEYDALFNAPQQGFNNPYLPQTIFPQTNRTEYVTQGTIQGPENAGVTNEQKVAQNQNPADQIPNLGNSVASSLKGMLNPNQTGGGMFSNAFKNFGNQVNNTVQNPEIPTVSLTKRQLNNPDGGNFFTKMFNNKGGNNPAGGGGGGGFNGKEFFSSEKGQGVSAIAGAGVGVASSVLKSALPDKYDPRVGMSKPGGNILADSQFTQIGLNPGLMAATGGISAIAGVGVDLVKNIVKYAKQKDQYENKKLATDTMQSIDDARENMKPDYTGYARFGTQVNNPYLKKYDGGGETPKYTYVWSSPNASTPTTVHLPHGTYNDIAAYGRPLKEIKKDAVSDLTAIYTSPGFRKKMQREKDLSEKLGYGKTYESSNELGKSSYYTSYDANDSVDDIINERLYRLNNTPVSLMTPDDDLYNDAYGYMQAYQSLWDRPIIKMNPSMTYGFPKSTLIEELEHASHLKRDMLWRGYNRHNITPGAKYIFDNYAPATSAASNKYTQKNYMQSYTEKLAKKRAAEQYMIDNKVLNPGEDVTIDHYNYLLKNYSKLPKNARELINMISENKDIQYNWPEVEEHNKKILREAEGTELIKKNKQYFEDLKNQLKNSKKTQENFFKVMNEVAKRDDNPLIATARFGTQVNNPYIKKYGPGGETVIVDGKEIRLDSNEYKRLYNSGNLLGVDGDGFPTVFAPEVEITAQMTDEERQRRKDQAMMEDIINNGPYTFKTGNAKPLPTSSVQSTEPSGINYTDPSVSWRKVRPSDVNFDVNTPEGRKNEAVFTANEAMDAIKNSKEYKETLRNAINESEAILNNDQENMMSDYFMVDGNMDYFLPGFVDDDYLKKNKQSLFNYQFNNPKGLYYDLEKQRNDKVDYSDVSLLDKEYIKENPYVGGYMQNSNYRGIPKIDGRKGVSNMKWIKIKDKGNIDDMVGTATEEIEHYQQFRPSKWAMSPYYSPYINENIGEPHNITPFESKVVDQYNTSDWDYLRLPYETAAKKRAAEVYFINQNMLKPGEKMGERHFDYLENEWMKNETNVPSNVMQFFELSLERPEEWEKAENEYRKNRDKRSEDEEVKAAKKRKDAKMNNFIMLSKLLAQNNKNPFLNEPIS